MLVGDPVCHVSLSKTLCKQSCAAALLGVLINKYKRGKLGRVLTFNLRGPLRIRLYHHPSFLIRRQFGNLEGQSLLEYTVRSVGATTR